MYSDQKTFMFKHFEIFGEHREDFDLVPHPDHKKQQQKMSMYCFLLIWLRSRGHGGPPQGLGEAFQDRLKNISAQNQQHILIRGWG